MSEAPKETTSVPATTPKDDEQPLSYDVAEKVLAEGDLGKLSPKQRVEYVINVCRSLGLNYRTRPFRFFKFEGGKVELYATKDCGEQLRALHKISLEIKSRQTEGKVHTVTAGATMPSGRHDEDIGSVALPDEPMSRANAYMRGVTKAKRRVTLSISGLGGIMDESELDNVPGVRTFDAEDESVPPEIEGKAEEVKPPPKARQTVAEWLVDYAKRCAAAKTRDEAEQILNDDQVRANENFLKARPDAWRDFEAARQGMIERLWKEDKDARNNG
jgi:hypothetical protein